MNSCNRLNKLSKNIKYKSYKILNKISIIFKFALIKLDILKCYYIKKYLNLSLYSAKHTFFYSHNNKDFSINLIQNLYGYQFY